MFTNSRRSLEASVRNEVIALKEVIQKLKLVNTKLVFLEVQDDPNLYLFSIDSSSRFC